MLGVFQKAGEEEHLVLLKSGLPDFLPSNCLRRDGWVLSGSRSWPGARCQYRSSRLAMIGISAGLEDDVVTAPSADPCCGIRNCWWRCALPESLRSEGY